jgi:hypothetical protein
MPAKGRGRSVGRANIDRLKRAETPFGRTAETGRVAGVQSGKRGASPKVRQRSQHLAFESSSALVMISGATTAGMN